MNRSYLGSSPRRPTNKEYLTFLENCGIIIIQNERVILGYGEPVKATGFDPVMEGAAPSTPTIHIKNHSQK